MTRYARELRVTIGDMYHWKQLPEFVVSHKDYSPDRTLAFKVYRYGSKTPRHFNYKRLYEKLEEAGWEVLEMVPHTTGNSKIRICMKYIVRKIEQEDLEITPELLSKPPRIELCGLAGDFQQEDKDCTCIAYGIHSCVQHSTEPHPLEEK